MAGAGVVVGVGKRCGENLEIRSGLAARLGAMHAVLLGVHAVCAAAPLSPVREVRLRSLCPFWKHQTDFRVEHAGAGSALQELLSKPARQVGLTLSDSCMGAFFGVSTRTYDLKD